jgi:hypothetical protein
MSAKSRIYRTVFLQTQLPTEKKASFTIHINNQLESATVVLEKLHVHAKP